MKIVVAMDAYKGCLDADEVCAAVAAGIREEHPRAEVVCVPLADGGEGMLDVLVRLTGGRRVTATVHDPLMRPLTACYGVLGDGVTAVVEMAQASGLPLLSVEERNPMLTTSYGTGELIRAALTAGYRHLILGIGGSATNDAGMGMMQALGAEFFDVEGRLLPVGCGQYLVRVERVDVSKMAPLTAGMHGVVACDVRNPFCGKLGAAAVFAPQKGATPEMVEALETGMRHFADVIHRQTGIDVATMAGAGAAGGMGGCLRAFFDAALRPGIDLILQQLHFEELLQGASLVVTGEGKADRQTLMGKVPAGVLHAAREKGVPVMLLAGAVEDAAALRAAGFQKVVAATPKGMPLKEALRPERAAENVREAARGGLGVRDEEGGVVVG